MILRKPYAFFIKIFKPIHIFLSFLVVILIYKTNNILTFLNQYIHSSESVVGQTIQSKLVSPDLFVIPISLIIFSLIFLGIMFNKKKPVLFYIGLTFVFLGIIIITMYSWSTLGAMEKNIISIKLVKLIHDLIVLNMIAEIVFFILLIIRGLGINFKKFNFDSDITKFDVEDSDKEEFEVNINFDVDAAKSKRKRKLRYFKYLYKENKIAFNIGFVMFFVVSILLFCGIYFKDDTSLKEGMVYNIGNFNLLVNNTILLDENFEGKKLTDNKLVVIDASLQTNMQNVTLFNKDFILEIGDANFYPETKFSNELIDLGETYNNNTLTQEYQHFLFVYEIPEKFSASEMIFDFNNQGNKTKIKLNPQQHKKTNNSQQKKVGEKMLFSGTLEGISFEILDYEIKEKYQIKYNFCVNDNECLISTEYIKPTINENFDKVVLKLVANYSNKGKFESNSFYDLFDKFGMIQYKKNGKWFYQSQGFEKLSSKKIDNKNNIYIGINEDIFSSESIKIVFDIRGSKYEYILK